MIRSLLRLLSYPVVLVLLPFKLLAYRSGSAVLRRIAIALTTPVDFALIWLNVQNETMLLHWRVYRGNFIFGRGVMVTDFPSTAAAVARTGYRGNNFMGVSIVSSDSGAFATNSGILNQCSPVRESTRAYLDRHVFTPEALAHDETTIGAACASILDEWSADPRMATSLKVRSTAARIFFKLLSGVTVPKDEADKATLKYVRRFVELSLFAGYLPFMTDLLGTHKYVRKDAYFKLHACGIDMLTVDVTMFAAMFSIGTLALRCVEDGQRFRIRYADLDPQRKRRFVTESLRLYPTVTSVHRIVEGDETVVVCGKPIALTAGDEVVYPFVCANRDPLYFRDPERMDLERPDEEYERVLSWSLGPHSCPAKALTTPVVVVMLDQLARRHDLATLRIFNPAF